MVGERTNPPRSGGPPGTTKPAPIDLRFRPLQQAPANPSLPSDFRVAALSVQLALACLAGGALAVGAGIAGQWAGSDAQALVIAALTPTAVWLVGAAVGLILLTSMSQGQRVRLPIGVMASSTARMLIALIVGVILYFLMTLDGRGFWTAFLLSGLLCLVVETAWAIRTINAGRATPTASGVS